MASEFKKIENNDPADYDAQLWAAKITYLFKNQTIGNIANVINASILAIIQWGVVNRSFLLTWIMAVIFIVIGRTIVGQLFFRQTQRRTSGWDTLFLAGAFCSAALWGVAGAVLFPAHSVVHQMFTAFTIGGMVAGDSAAYCAMLRAFFGLGSIFGQLRHR